MEAATVHSNNDLIAQRVEDFFLQPWSPRLVPDEERCAGLLRAIATIAAIIITGGLALFFFAGKAIFDAVHRRNLENLAANIERIQYPALRELLPAISGSNMNILVEELANANYEDGSHTTANFQKDLFLVCIGVGTGCENMTIDFDYLRSNEDIFSDLRGIKNILHNILRANAEIRIGIRNYEDLNFADLPDNPIEAHINFVNGLPGHNLGTRDEVLRHLRAGITFNS